MKKKLSLEEVQKNLSEIIEQLKQNGGYVEVVENHHIAAVILNFDQFEKFKKFIPDLLTADTKAKPDWKIRGSVRITEDFEEASAEISKSIWESIEKQEL